MEKTMVLFGGEGGHPGYSANLDKHGQDPSVSCVYCGRYAGTAKTFVFLSDAGEHITPEAAESLCDYLGLYPIGSDCAQKAKAAGVPLYDTNCKRI